MEETKSQYLKVIESSRKVFKDKNLDYGSSWRILRVSSFVDQIHIKAQRIRNLQINEDQKIDEGKVPEFIGIINDFFKFIICTHAIAISSTYKKSLFAFPEPQIVIFLFLFIFEI